MPDTFPPGTTLPVRIVPVNETNQFQAADSTPAADGLILYKNGALLAVNADYTATVSADARGYDLTITLVAAAVVGDSFHVILPMLFSTVTWHYQELHDCTGDATLAKQNTILAAIAAIDPAAEPLNGQQDTTATDTLAIFIGDDYTDDSPRGALSWAVSPAVDLTDAEGTFRVWVEGAAANLIEEELDFANVGDEDQLCKVELTAAQMAAAGLRVAATYQFQAAITLADGTKWTPAQGSFSPRRKRRGD